MNPRAIPKESRSTLTFPIPSVFGVRHLDVGATRVQSYLLKQGGTSLNTEALKLVGTKCPGFLACLSNFGYAILLVHCVGYVQELQGLRFDGNFTSTEKTQQCSILSTQPLHVYGSTSTYILPTSPMLAYQSHEMSRNYEYME